MEHNYTGGCLCGNIRFVAKGKPDNPHTCSCKMCQRHSGALTQVWVEFDSKNVSWEGPGGQPKTWRSSEASSRSFCEVCGSTLGAIDDDPVVALPLGVFDATSSAALKPNANYHESQTPPWWHNQVE